MDVFPHPRCAGRRSLLAWVTVALAAVEAAADEPASAPPETPAPAFQPGEISIGEPIPLPFGGRGPAPVQPDAPAKPTVPPGDDPQAAAPPNMPETGAVPGSGWLGLAVATSNVPGRWRIEHVTTGGPADRAGIVVGDELRAVNGVALASDAEVSQALTSIAAGQDVRVAVARAERVSDVVLRAEHRPLVRGDQSSTAEASALTGVPARATPAATSTASTPAQTTPAASNPAWQASQPQTSADAARFGPATTREQPAVAVRTPGPMPRPAADPAPMPSPAAGGGGSPGGRTALGVRSVPVDPATQARFNLASPAGAYVVGVVHDLPAARAGVPPGSVIVALNDHPVRSPLELTELVTSGPLDKPVTLQFVLPGGEAKRADVVLQSLDVPLERVLTGGVERAASPADLQPGPLPRRAERRSSDDGPIRAEIRALRSRLERLERVLDPRGGDGR